MDEHEIIWSEVARGIAPPPPKPAPKANLLGVDPITRGRLGATGNLGLLDTLVGLAGGRQPSSIKTETTEGRLGLGDIGMYEPTSDEVMLAPQLAEDDFRDVVIHEFGHFLGMKSSAVPELKKAHRGSQDYGEPAARAFTRAVQALSALRTDTTNSEGVLSMFERGQHAKLGRVERDRGHNFRTRDLFVELLGTPMYSNHPLAKKREQYR